MKKIFLNLLLLSVVSITQAQNGGIMGENESLRLEFVGHSNGMTVVKTTNKDTCEASMKVQWGPLYRSKDVMALQADTFHLPQQTTRFIQAYSISPCRGYLGVVEIDNFTVLPIKFEYITVRQVADRIVNVQFKVSEVDDTDRFNIQVSKDGKNFQTVEIVLPDKIQPNKIYNINVKI